MQALEFGVCGECPSEAPSMSPTRQPTGMPSVTPTSAPTAAPTGALDLCELVPPSCTIEPDDGEDRVTFCLVIVIQIERCVLEQNVRSLISLGKANLFHVISSVLWHSRHKY